MSNRIGIGIDVFGAGIDADATTIYNRIIADGGVSNLTRLNFFVKGLKAIYGDLANVPVCYDAHWIGYKLGSGTGATAGQAAAKLYSLTVAADAVQATAASQPLLLAHNGVDNYFYVPRVDGNNCTTPDTVASRIAGDIEIISYIELKGTEADRTIIAKGGLSVGNFVLAVGSSNIPYFIQGDLVLKNATAALPNVNTWLRVTRVSSTGDIKFWTSTDTKTTAPLSVTWTQLGSTVSGTAGNRSTTTDSIFVGKYNQYTNNSFNGNIFRATISNSIGGTPVVDFNPATYNAATSQTQWTSTTGEIWTINKPSTATLQGSLVDRTQVIGNGSSYFMSNSATSLRPNSSTQYVVFSTIFNDAGGNKMIIDSNSSDWYNSISNGNTTNVQLYMNGSSGVINTPKSLNSFDLIIASTNAGVQNALRKNNGTDTTNSYSPTPSGNGITLLARLSAGTGSPAILNTYICVNAIDSGATKTATYNLIRSLNNNAF
jgi:hypothetical protein